jgi:hypothetical protein
MGGTSDDLDELARRYLDLWQDQMTALANDPEMAEAMERALRQWGLAPGDGAWQAPGGGPAPGGWSAGWPGGPGAMGPAAAMAWPQAMMAALQAVMQTAVAMPGGGAAGWPTPGAPQGQGAAQDTRDGTQGTGAHAGHDGGAAHAEPGAQGAAHGSAAAAGASAGGDLDLEQLLGRLAGLEERVAALEDPGKPAGSGGKSGKSKGRGRKHGA